MKLRLPFMALLIGAGLMQLAAVPLLAHHSFAAEYDSSQGVTLTGKVVKMDWVNPHSWIHMEVINRETGKTEVWDVETGPPNTLYRNGWRKDVARPGDDIVVVGSRAKNGTNTVNARSVKTTDGRTLLAGSSENTPGASGAATPQPATPKQ
jgi:hypothetical protein